MRVTIHPHGLPLDGNDEGFERSPGLHISDLYGSLFKQLQPSRYDKRNDDGTPEEMDWVKVFAGSAFETRLEKRIEAVDGGSRPGEFFTQHERSCSLYGRKVTNGRVICHCGAGIAYSPDWLFYFPREIILGEFKFTWYSLRDFPHHEKFDKWVMQVACYLYHLRLTKARLYPYWVNSHYPKGKPSPTFDNYYLMEFTRKETAQHWGDLLRHGRKEGMIPNEPHRSGR